MKKKNLLKTIVLLSVLLGGSAYSDVPSDYKIPLTEAECTAQSLHWDPIFKACFTEVPEANCTTQTAGGTYVQACNPCTEKCLLQGSGKGTCSKVSPARFLDKDGVCKIQEAEPLPGESPVVHPACVACQECQTCYPRSPNPDRSCRGKATCGAEQGCLSTCDKEPKCEEQAYDACTHECKNGRITERSKFRKCPEGRCVLRTDSCVRPAPVPPVVPLDPLFR
jgi:hypothetical protein